ncbi:patatin-like phospholipase family protein [Ciceribacter sp. L1K22]|uniref:patatin-like phospholipase family protein n=1 Tax=Ciceribacter sp. L1K22 TaxID=2820275 RepID=UPI001ABE8EE3|nr:patatin-like phospholipase family protein [Ciceribacter sp. L1K22]
MTDNATPSLSKANDPTVAIALGAGGARGFAHISVIEALDEMGIRPVCIAGASMGALIGAGMAAGMRGREIREYVLETVGKRSTVANRLWNLGPGTMRDALGGFRLGQFNLERILAAFLPPELPADFSALRIPLKVVTTDYYAQSESIREEGALHPALAASAAIPVLFMPVEIDGRIMVDGGIVNPVPYEHLRPLADIVIAVDVVGAPDGEGVPNRFDSLFGASQLMMQSMIALKLKLSKPDIFLRPPVNAFRVLDFVKARQVLEAADGVKDDLKRQIETAIEVRLRSAIA